MTGTARFHLALGVLVCVVLPGASYVDGSGRLAYGMFRATHEYALDVVAVLPDGQTRAVSPTELAVAAGGSAGLFFAGLDHFRRSAVTDMPRRHLDDIARLACRVAAAREVTVTLKERDDPASPITGVTKRIACPAQ
jgi:hypothetical protein